MSSVNLSMSLHQHYTEERICVPLRWSSLDVLQNQRLVSFSWRDWTDWLAWWRQTTELEGRTWGKSRGQRQPNCKEWTILRLRRRIRRCQGMSLNAVLSRTGVDESFRTREILIKIFIFKLRWQRDIGFTQVNRHTTVVIRLHRIIIRSIYKLFEGRGMTAWQNTTFEPCLSNI